MFWKKLLKRFSVAAIGFILLILLDMAIFGSIYHPLIYPYKILSAIECNFSTAPSCKNIDAIAVKGKNGMVVSSQDDAAKIGLEILKDGGNAIDAAVAVGYALAASDPCCGNIGGGGFMLIHLANGKDTFINFRETAPLAATRDMYADKPNKASKNGYLAVAIPGTVKGLEYALEQYGTMSREQVISGAIELAEDGFILEAGDTRILNFGKNQFKQEENVAEIFLKDGKKSYQEGDRLVQTDLAATLKSIRDRGESAFYNGEIAREIVKASQNNNGILSLEDFTTYAIEELKPIECNYRGYRIISAPPPGGGVTLCQMLAILSQYEFVKADFPTPENLHWFFSSMLFAYADRNTLLGDPNFVNNPVEKLISPEYAAEIKRKIPENRAIKPGSISTTKEGKHTTHYSIIDRAGNAVSVTYTINSYFGAGVIAGNTGFFLNNEMDDFTTKPNQPNQFGLIQGKNNEIAPKKRPLSSMTPTIVTKNNAVFLITGSPGGSTIPTTVLQVITNIIDRNLSLAKSVNNPRFHYQVTPDIVITEPYGVNSDTFVKLWSKGYKVIPFFNWGAAESILVDPETGEFFGANDRRKLNGKAVSY